MPNRSPQLRRFRLLAAALIVATGGAASRGHTQQVTGSIGASLTILEPEAAPGLRITGFDVDRDGIARIETTVPSPVRTSQLVMTRIWNSTTGFTPEPQPPMLIAPSSGAIRTRYRVSVGRERRAGRARPSELRVELLIIAAGI